MKPKRDLRRPVSEDCLAPRSDRGAELLNLHDIPRSSSVVHVVIERLRRAMDQEIARTLDAEGLKVAEWRILYVLAVEGAMPQRDLVQRIVIDQALASRTMKIMQKTGWIVLERSADDLRVWNCTLTKAGRDVFDRTNAIMQNRRRYLDGALSKHDLEFFLTCAKRVAVRVADAGERPARLNR